MSTCEQSELLDMIARIGMANSIEESLALFKIAGSQLEHCKFIFASKRGGTPGFSVNRTFSAGGAIRSLFNTEKVFVLDQQTVKEMQKGSASYFSDYSISLDTQALSYLEPFLRGVKSRIPKDFEEVFGFIAREDVNVDPLPYTVENLHNLDSPEAADRIYDKLKAYQRLRTLDANWFRTKGEVRSKLSEAEIVKCAQEQIAGMFESLVDEKEMSEITFCHQVMYCQLLMMVLIQLREPRLSVSAKLQEFLQFLDSELATIFARETVIAHSFFMRGQKFTFFGKIQIKKPDLFQVLDGMAWDLWHVRQLEKLMTLKPLQNARYFFPALLTFDKRFTEVIDLYPLKS